MKKKKKGKNPQQIKSEKAHQRNIYLQRIKTMMGIMGSEAAYDLLDETEILMLCTCRLTTVKIISSPNEKRKISKDELKQINDHLTKIFKDNYVQVGIPKQPVSIYDFYTITETLYIYWRNVTKTSFIHAEKFKEALPGFKDDYIKIRENVFAELESLFFFLSCLLADIRYKLVWFEISSSDNKNDVFDRSVFYNNFIARFEIPESVTIDLDGFKRSIYRVGIVGPTGVNWMVMTPQMLGIEGVLSKLPLQVYIQSHAVDRIKERLGEYFSHFMYVDILSSLLFKEITPADNGGYLFAYNTLNIKVGYLKVSIVGDKLIIRTFLFLTNNGTPEGKKLETILGLQKEDKKYLGIDKLSTFLDSDFEQNEKLKKIFDMSGCSALFGLKKSKNIEQKSNIERASFLMSYLGLKNEPDIQISNHQKITEGFQISVDYEEKE